MAIDGMEIWKGVRWGAEDCSAANSVYLGDHSAHIRQPTTACSFLSRCSDALFWCFPVTALTCTCTYPCPRSDTQAHTFLNFTKRKKKVVREQGGIMQHWKYSVSWTECSFHVFLFCFSPNSTFSLYQLLCCFTMNGFRFAPQHCSFGPLHLPRVSSHCPHLETATQALTGGFAGQQIMLSCS